MQKFALTILLLALFCSGCSFQKESAQQGITLDVAVFEGGYGLDWHKNVARQYEKLHPGIRVHLWGDPRVDEKIRPLILRHNPPDLASCTLPVWKLIVAGKLSPLDSELETPAYGQNRTWRDSLVPGILVDFQYQGKSYAMPTNLSAWVCWYDARMFRQHGWQVPKTWDEFTRLCAQIKAAGIAPLAFQGKYPYYAWWTIVSLYERLVPFEKFYAMQDLKPGAFTDPDWIHAAKLLQDMAISSYEQGALAMTHTESQLEFVNGRAAMVFCGLWLKNEMKNAIPPGFEMRCFTVPSVEGGKGDQQAINGGGAENFVVFSEGKHPKEAMDFLKYMTSIEASRAYIQRLDSLTPVRDSEKGIPISPELQSAVDVVHHSSRIYSDRLSSLYLEWNKSVLSDALADLVSGKTTPEQFGARLEAGIDAVRSNPEIYKPPAMGVPKLQ